MADPNSQAAVLKLFAPRGSPSAYTIRDFLHRSDIPFEYVELKSDEEARRYAGVDNLKDPRLPLCIFHDGTRMESPTLRRIIEKLGWFRDPSRSEYDLAIYGAGPAGLSPTSAVA
jgi:thioredoxin reductase (NADPH)